MNKVYKLVWNASIGVWVAVSELAKSKVKSKTIKVSAAVILVNFTVGMGTSYADDVIQGSNIQVVTDNSDPLNIKHTISTSDNVVFKNVTVGSVVVDSTSNKISGLSDGVNNNDAATFGQLKTVDDKVSQNSSDISSLNSSVSKNTGDISTLNSNVSKNTGDISSLNNRVTVNEGDIANLQSSVGGISNQTWKIQANGDAASSVKASDTVQFLDGTNIAITRSGNNLTVATKPEVSFDKVTVDGVVIDNGQITVTKNATVGSGSKEVVTGDQLYKVEQDLLNAGIERAKYFHATSVLDDSVADGTDSVAVGPKAVTNSAATDAVAIGNNAVVGTATVGGTPATDGIESIAIGKDTKALGNKNTVIGQAATTDTKEITSSIAIGDGAKISGTNTKNAIAVGSNSIASAENASAFGTSAEASASNATAVGKGAKAASGSATALGDSAIASGANSTALGSGAQANSTSAISLGANAGVGTVNNAGNSNQNHIAIGTSAGQNIKGNENIAIGLEASNGTSGNYNIAIGSKSGQASTGEENVSIGYLSNQNAKETDHTTAIGGRSISGQAAVAVGYLASADNQGAVAIGAASKVEGIDDGSGTGTKKNADNGVAVGINAWSKDNSIALGSNSVASKDLAETQTGYLTSSKTSNQGVISVGSDGSGGVAAFNRRIAHVDDGADGYDAVNVRQLKIAQEKVGNLIGGDVSVDNNGNYSQITLKDNNGKEYKYNTVVDALGAISSGAVLPSVDNAVTYTDATSKQINLRPNTVISGLAPGKVGTDAVNLAQMQEAVEASRVKYISVKSEAIGNKNNEGASGVDAVAIGPEAIAQNKNSTAIGSQVYALGDNATTIGSTGTIAYDAAGVAIGQHAISRGENSIVIGKDAKSEPQTSNDKVNDAIAVGTNALVTNNKGIAIGKETIARGEESIAQGYDARASADRALAVGVSSRSSSTDALALGTQASASGTNALATGKQANANARDSIATGTQATSYATNAIALGNNAISGKANPTKDEIDNNLNSNTIAIGTDSFAKIQSAIALGNTARATEENTIAVGKNSKVEAKDAIAIGLDAQTIGANGVALGKQAKADGENALAQGVSAKALNTNAIAQGNNAQAIADNATAIGANALATGSAAISQGFNAKALNTNTIAQGTNAQATAEGATAIGANTVVNHNNAVALGNGSQSADYVQTTSTVINGKTYNFAGTPTNSSSVSVGSAGNERTIVNVAAGRISSTSTDAINGSQLHQTNTAIEDLANTALTFQVDSGTNVQRKLGETLNVVGGVTDASKLTDNNIGVIADGNNKLTVKLAKDVKVDSVNAAGTLINSNGLSFVDGSGNAIANSPSISKNGISAGNQKITNVAKGDVNATSTDAVNGSQLNEVQQIANKGWNLTTNNNAASKSNVAPDGTVDISNADSNLVISNQGNNVDIRLANQVTIGSGTGSNPVTVNGVTGRINGLTNTTWDPNTTYNSKQAATEEQLKSVSDVAQNANKGWNVRSDSNLAATQVKPTDTVDIGLATGESNLKSTAVNDGKGTTTIDFSLSRDLNIDTVTAGTGTNKTVLSQTGVNIENGTTQTQLEAGKVVVKNTANTLTLDAGKGTLEGLSNKDISSADFATQGRAATEEQLKQIQTGLTDSGFGLTAADGNSVQKKLGQTVDVVGADSNITTKVDQGKLAIELSKDLAVNSVNAAGTLINSNGLSFVDGSGNAIANSPSISKNGISAGNQKITNVAKGDVNATSTDAVNGSQLNEVQQIANKGWNLTTNNNAASKSNVAPDGTVDISNADSNLVISNQGNNVDIRLANQVTIGSGTGSNPVTVNGVTGRINGLTNTTWDPNASYNNKQAATEEQLKSVSDVAQNANKGWNVKSDSNLAATQVKPTDTVDIGLATGETNLKSTAVNDGKGTTTIDFSLSKDLNIDSVNAAGTLINSNGLSFVDGSGNAIANSPSISKNGISAGNQKITNVAKGDVNATSTDAVNGSQLNEVQQIANKGWNLTTNNNAASKSNVAPDGTVDISNADSNLVISNQGNNVDIRLANQVTIGSGTGSNPVTVNGVTGRINGLTNTTWDPNASYNNKQAATEEQLKSVSDVAQNANKGWNVKSDSNLAATQVKPTDTVDIGLATGESNLKSTAVNDGKGTTTIDFSLSKDLKVDSVNAAGTLINSNGLSFVDGSGNAIANSPSISKNGISAGNQKITNVAKGDVNATSTDAVNGSQLNEVQQIANKGWNLTTNNNAASKSNVAPDGTVDISNADSNLVISNQGNNVDIRLANQVTIGSGTGSNPVTVNGVTGRINGLTNTTWDPNATYNSKQAATEEQLKSVSDVAQNANKGWNVKSDSNLAATQVKPTDTVDIGLATGESNLKSTAVNDGKGTTTIDFSLSRDLNIDTVTAGTGANKTVLRQAGVNIENGTTQTQLEAGKVVVKNTANTLTLDAGKGTLEGLSNKDISSADFATQGRAATEEQLKQIQTGLTDSGFGLTAADGNSVQKKLGQTVDVVGADSNITTKVDQGKLAIELSKDLAVNSVNAAGTLINSNGLSFVDGSGNTIANSPSISKNGISAGNQKITNVAKGDVNATSTEAVNGSQLFAVGDGVKNIIGGTTTYDPNTGTFINNNIGNTGESTIHDAIKSVNNTVQTVSKGWNLTTNGQNSSQVKPTDTVDFANKDGNIKVNNTGNNVTVDLAKDIKVDSVQAGNSTLNNNGLTIKDGPSVTQNGIDAGNKKITNVAEGSIAKNSKDAVNGSQLHDMLGDGAFVGGDGNTITNIGGTGATNINDAISSINQKAGQHSTVVAGQNMTVTQTTNSSGGKEFKVATNDDVTFKTVTTQKVTADNVTVGDVQITKAGINAGNKVISNVADGAVNSTSKEAVNGSQLNTSNQYITKSLGGGAKYENGKFTEPTYNVNNGSYNNVGDALGALNQANINIGNQINNLGDRIEQVFYETNGRIDNLEEKMSAGIAANAALEQAPYVAGKVTLAVGAGYYNNQNAVGVTLRKTADNGRWSLTSGAALGSQGGALVRVGVSTVLD
ncbi:ESPR-type extended signal peptide-containing protein [Acinetobacter sp. C26G]|uniref:ESPR-type extended signal peptide-containing protein n=1 Tax=Acinetobacter sp. C26G TaxID=2950075 RepID=UPI002036E424|nr:ESPR-type extended signal peptide-containing protein [Acinetobacter sp. C26G]USA51290.1 YadA-like family protein [Acinetobacter sp. C26G]